MNYPPENTSTQYQAPIQVNQPLVANAHYRTPCSFIECIVCAIFFFGGILVCYILISSGHAKNLFYGLIPLLLTLLAIIIGYSLFFYRY